MSYASRAKRRLASTMQSRARTRRRVEGIASSDNGVHRLIRPSQSRHYAAASMGRLVGDWVPSAQDVNALIGGASPLVRARVRDLVRNFPPFTAAASAIATYSVGSGSRFQSLVTKADGTPDYALRNKIESRYRAFMDEADIAGQLHFYEMVMLAQRQEVENGEAIIRFAKPRRRKTFPFALHMIEADDLVSHLDFKTDDNSEIQQGIEYDIRTGERLYYHFQKKAGLTRLYDTWREPAENVIHFFQTLRPGQLRGISPLAAAVMIAYDMNEYIGAEIDASKLAAKWLGFITTTDPQMFQMTHMSTTGRGTSPLMAEALGRGEIDEVENAIIDYLRPGEKVEFAPNAGRMTDSFERFVAFCLRMLSIVARVPYELVSADYSELNYSKAKMSQNDFSKFLFPRKFAIEHHIERRVFKQFLAFEALTQDYLPGYFTNPARYQPAMFVPQGLTSPDPLRDGKANIDKLRAGLVSHIDLILADGRDPEQVVEQNKLWAELCIEHGVNPLTGMPSTAMANNPAALGASEYLDDNDLLREEEE